MRTCPGSDGKVPAGGRLGMIPGDPRRELGLGGQGPREPRLLAACLGLPGADILAGGREAPSSASRRNPGGRALQRAWCQRWWCRVLLSSWPCLCAQPLPDTSRQRSAQRSWARPGRHLRAPAGGHTELRSSGLATCPVVRATGSSPLLAGPAAVGVSSLGPGWSRKGTSCQPARKQVSAPSTCLLPGARPTLGPE